MLRVMHDLVANTPDASPVIVYILRDAPAVAIPWCPIAKVSANAPLTNRIFDVAVRSVEFARHLGEANGWIWLVRIINYEALSDVCPTIVVFKRIASP